MRGVTKTQKCPRDVSWAFGIFFLYSFLFIILITFLDMMMTRDEDKRDTNDKSSFVICTLGLRCVWVSDDHTYAGLAGVGLCSSSETVHTHLVIWPCSFINPESISFLSASSLPSLVFGSPVLGPAKDWDRTRTGPQKTGKLKDRKRPGPQKTDKDRFKIGLW